MEYLGFLAFILVIFNTDLPDKFKKLKNEMRIIKRSIKGESIMSEILKELEGKKCRLEIQGSLEPSIECDVISVDGEWLKINQIPKKGERQIKLIRIEKIDEVSIL